MAGIHKIAEINHTLDNLCGEKIHDSVKRALVSRFVNLLKEGISYQIRYFGVGLNKSNFKITHHEYVVNLNQRTDVHRFPESSSISRYGFNFVSFDTLNTPGYDYTYLVDVVGYLARIRSEKILKKDDKSTKYTIIELEIDDGKILECALFGNYAHELNIFLGSDNKDGAVVVLQFVRFYRKNYFNLEEANVIQFKNRWFVRFKKSRSNISAISNEAAFLKIYQGKNIEQLKELGTNAVCVVLATISHIIDTPDWWYDQCECNSKYRIKFGVIDDSDCACFVKGDLSNTPTSLLNLIDKTFFFIVKVQISDNSHFSPSYKVKKMTDNVHLINKFKKAHPIQIVSTVISNLLIEFSNEVVDNDKF
ncbi:hypothetical protein Ahy_A06g030089 [Arachis hypogaea]|uniref:Replication protein A 70 kDa DNA-binding subunit B/D first OB fold domain-containing protein n=1 Tax=Arachis hypogaea TaxID=3818 RepID=A0A445CVA0_ARAHY|nr:hypothetical protein Ahy_A06g030089 [Arachis hypogaea]